MGGALPQRTFGHSQVSQKTAWIPKSLTHTNSPGYQNKETQSYINKPPETSHNDHIKKLPQKIPPPKKGFQVPKFVFLNREILGLKTLQMEGTFRSCLMALCLARWIQRDSVCGSLSGRWFNLSTLGLTASTFGSTSGSHGRARFHLDFPSGKLRYQHSD